MNGCRRPNVLRNLLNHTGCRPQTDCIWYMQLTTTAVAKVCKKTVKSDWQTPANWFIKFTSWWEQEQVSLTVATKLHNNKFFRKAKTSFVYTSRRKLWVHPARTPNALHLLSLTKIMCPAYGRLNSKQEDWLLNALLHLPCFYNEHYEILFDPREGNEVFARQCYVSTLMSHALQELMLSKTWRWLNVRRRSFCTRMHEEDVAECPRLAFWNIELVVAPSLFPVETTHCPWPMQVVLLPYWRTGCLGVCICLYVSVSCGTRSASQHNNSLSSQWST